MADDDQTVSYALTPSDPEDAEAYRAEADPSWTIAEQEAIFLLARGESFAAVCNALNWKPSQLAAFYRRHDVQRAVFSVRSHSVNEFWGTMSAAMGAISEKIVELATSDHAPTAVQGCRLAVDVLKLQDQREAVEAIWQLQKKLGD